MVSGYILKCITLFSCIFYRAVTNSLKYSINWKRIIAYETLGWIWSFFLNHTYILDIYLLSHVSCKIFPLVFYKKNKNNIIRSRKLRDACFTFYMKLSSALIYNCPNILINKVEMKCSIKYYINYTFDKIRLKISCNNPFRACIWRSLYYLNLFMENLIAWKTELLLYFKW